MLLSGQVTSAGVVRQQACHSVLERGEGRPGERVLDGGVVHTDPLLEPVQDDSETLKMNQLLLGDQFQVCE